MNEKEKFIAELYPEARNISQETGMSWELILAQAALETGWGQKVLPGTYNLFNIKADQGWHGAKKTINNVWEQDRKTGKDIYIDQSFRVYDSYKDALRDRVQFLKSNPRYGKAGYFEDGTLGDLRKEADALQTAGYATDMNYSEKLAKLFASPTMQRGIALAREQEIAQRQSASIRKIGETLREGTKSFSVGELQTRLRHLGYTDTHGRPLQSDHHFGPATRAAVERFQRDHGLVDDGTVGPATQAALRQAVLVAASASLDTRTVRTLQQQLNVLGVTDMNQQAVDVNGVYDLATRTAVARFQSEQGVPVTGQADETTRTLLKSQAFIADLQRLPAFMPATEAETPSRAMAATPALQLGDISPAVRALQHQLNQLGYTDTHGQPLRTDHHFGPRHPCRGAGFSTRSWAGRGWHGGSAHARHAGTPKPTIPITNRQNVRTAGAWSARRTCAQRSAPHLRRSQPPAACAIRAIERAAAARNHRSAPSAIDRRLLQGRHQTAAATAPDPHPR